MKSWPSSGDGPGARKESRRFKTAPEVWQYVCLKHHITLRPFSFVEYLEAKGYDDWAESVRGLNAHTLLHTGPAYSRP